MPVSKNSFAALDGMTEEEQQQHEAAAAETATSKEKKRAGSSGGDGASEGKEEDGPADPRRPGRKFVRNPLVWVDLEMTGAGGRGV